MKTNLLIIISSLITFTSCEKIIEIPLDEKERKIVVEGNLTNQTGRSFILLSKTGSVYDDNGFEKVGSASILVTDKNGIQFTFTEQVNGSGKYENATFTTKENDKYALEINSDGLSVSSTSITDVTPVISNLSYSIDANSGGGAFGEPGGSTLDSIITVSFSFNDISLKNNYFKVKGWINGVLEDIGESQSLFNDGSFNGGTRNFDFVTSTAKRGDVILIELLSIDEKNYNFSSSLSNAGGAGPFGATPANPISNIEGDAIGYFGAFLSDTVSVVIPN